MTTMTGSLFSSSPSEEPPTGDDADEPIFKSLVVTNPKKVKSWWGVGSLAGHSLIITAMILIPLYWGEEPPDRSNLINVLIYNPPPPPPPPLPKGSALVEKPKPTQPVTPDPHPVKPEFTAPVETPKEEPLKPEARLPETEQAGSANGSDLGVPEGMEEGQEGGVVGGVPGGVLGGCVGCTGDGPVQDYDQPPKPIKITRPQYPQEAFVKKIEGTVVVEILIDANGRVYPRRILTSIPALDAAAVETVKQWVFSPAIKRGRPVATVAHAPVGFRIF
jgi:periplasmic protein TonB